MRTNLFKSGAILLLSGCLATMALAADRPVDKILADIKAVETPKPTGQFKSQAEFTEFYTKLQKAMADKSKLIGELYKADPENAELATLMPERWQALAMAGKPADEATAKAEIEEVTAKSKNPKLVTEAQFSKVVMAFQKAGQNPDIDVLAPLADDFAKKYPKDERTPKILASIESLKKAQVAERRQKDSIGKPFELEFTDAIKGSQVSMKTLKGKVVIVDFWATWCGPCVAEMPKMKKLYAEYKDKGVEFIGVSLDQPKEQGGYDKLKAYVEKNDIQWPQYYQGNFWQSDFSASWGINSIPCVFAIDAEGNLFTTKARGKLETLIPELLEKAKKTQATP